VRRKKNGNVTGKVEWIAAKDNACRSPATTRSTKEILINTAKKKLSGKIKMSQFIY
jgi:hypothetical protein